MLARHKPLPRNILFLHWKDSIRPQCKGCLHHKRVYLRNSHYCKFGELGRGRWEDYRALAGHRMVGLGKDRHKLRILGYHLYLDHHSTHCLGLYNRHCFDKIHTLQGRLCRLRRRNTHQVPGRDSLQSILARRRQLFGIRRHNSLSRQYTGNLLHIQDYPSEEEGGMKVRMAESHK